MSDRAWLDQRRRLADELLRWTEQLPAWFNGSEPPQAFLFRDGNWTVRVEPADPQRVIETLDLIFKNAKLPARRAEWNRRKESLMT